MMLIFVFTQLLIMGLTMADFNSLSNDIEPDYIECYWCNSRDIYCGKRVTDTMVTTIKCPKHSKCTVYTNPYDNYYLHRGCTYGMDLGQMEIENGCFVEEDGSTYCFCDFNRCNAAGILDLRNLIDDKNETGSLIENQQDEQEDIYIENNIYRNQEQLDNFKQSTISNSIIFDTTTTAPIQETRERNSVFPFPTTYNSASNNLDQLLSDYLNFSKTQQNKLKLSQPLFVNNTTEIFEPSTTKSKLVYSIFPSTTFPMPTTTSTVKAPPTTQKIKLTDNFLKFFKTSKTISSTGANQIQSTTVLSTHQLPSLYKLQINETLSLRTKLGLKPEEKVNILLLKSPTTEEFTVSTSDVPTTKIIPTRQNMFKTAGLGGATTSTLSWLSKLKAKLTSPQEKSGYLKQTTESYDWTYVLSDKYKQGLNINFKCPRDGLFSHPTNCGQFLQCVYFGTIHERFYILNCPSGLYFNQRLELCDYPQNTNCLF